MDTEGLFDWLTEVRRLCVEHGREKIGDQMIGELLSKAPADEDGSLAMHSSLRGDGENCFRRSRYSLQVRRY